MIINFDNKRKCTSAMYAIMYLEVSTLNSAYNYAKVLSCWTLVYDGSSLSASSRFLSASVELC